MAIRNKNKINKITVNIPNMIYERFRSKSYEDGYSMQIALRILVEHYANDKIIVKT